MSTDQAEDLALRNLQRLPVIEPDAARAAHVRAKCHAALARRQPKSRRITHALRGAVFAIESALIGALGVSYFVALIMDALRLYGFR